MENKRTLLSALASVQAELKVGKGRKNAYGGFMYRSCADIFEGVKPLLVKHGLLLTVSDAIVEIGGRIYVQATATVTCSENSGETISCSAYAREPSERKGMDESQVTGSASSYARKYALGGLFLIDDSVDPDSPAANGKELAKALVDVERATSKEQLDACWNAHPNLHSNQNFIDIMNDKAKAIQR